MSKHSSVLPHSHKGQSTYFLCILYRSIYHLNASSKWSQSVFNHVLFRTAGSPPFHSSQTSPISDSQKKNVFFHLPSTFCLRINYHLLTRARLTLMHFTLWALNNCIDRHNTDFPSLLLPTRYLCQCCHTRARSGGGKGLSPCTSQEDCGMTPLPCCRTKVRADTASSASPSALRASARVASGNWEQSHSHTPTNTACPSVPTHLHSALSLSHPTLSLKHYLFSL